MVDDLLERGGAVVVEVRRGVADAAQARTSSSSQSSGNKESFLRELISNASGAGDKLRFEAMTDAALFESDPDPKIRVIYDPHARTITVADNGIGMSRQEVIEHIGTIAKSGLTTPTLRDGHPLGAGT
jgi:hypothetical protein